MGSSRWTTAPRWGETKTGSSTYGSTETRGRTSTAMEGGTSSKTSTTIGSSTAVTPSSTPLPGSRSSSATVAARSSILGDRNFVLDVNTNRTSGPYFREFGDSRTRDTVKEDVSHYVDDLLGSHDIKMGAIFEREGFDRETIRRPIIRLRTGSLNLI